MEKYMKYTMYKKVTTDKKYRDNTLFGQLISKRMKPDI